MFTFISTATGYESYQDIPQKVYVTVLSCSLYYLALCKAAGRAYLQKNATLVQPAEPPNLPCKFLLADCRPIERKRADAGDGSNVI